MKEIMWPSVTVGVTGETIIMVKREKKQAGKEGSPVPEDVSLQERLH